MMRSGHDPMQMEQSAAPGRLRKRIAFFILVDRAERTLFRTPLALRTALHEEFRIGQVTGPGVNCHAPGGECDALDGLHGGAGSVFNGVCNTHGAADRTGRIYTRSTALIWETDKVGIGKPVLKFGKLRTLAVLQVQNV